MPRPPRLCSCGRIVAHGTRCQCQITSTRERNRRHDARRPSARQRGYDSDWQKARAEFLKVHNVCAMPDCMAQATTVDHRIPHRGDRTLFWDRNNWQPLCTSCHSRRKQRQERQP